MDREIVISLKDYLDKQEERALAHHKEILVQCVEIKAKQDLTNGRVRAAEMSIAVLQWAYALGMAVMGWLVWKLEQ